MTAPSSNFQLKPSWMHNKNPNRTNDVKELKLFIDYKYFLKFNSLSVIILLICNKSESLYHENDERVEPLFGWLGFGLHGYKLKPKLLFYGPCTEFSKRHLIYYRPTVEMQKIQSKIKFWTQTNYLTCQILFHRKIFHLLNNN